MCSRILTFLSGRLDGVQEEEEEEEEEEECLQFHLVGVFK
jgi:hypothetical protein